MHQITKRMAAAASPRVIAERRKMHKGAALLFIGVLLCCFTSVADSATYTFKLGNNAQAQPTPPLVVGDVLNITFDDGESIALFPNIYEWHSCRLNLPQAKPLDPVPVPLTPMPRPSPRPPHSSPKPPSTSPRPPRSPPRRRASPRPRPPPTSRKQGMHPRGVGMHRKPKQRSRTINQVQKPTNPIVRRKLPAVPITGAVTSRTSPLVLNCNSPGYYYVASTRPASCSLDGVRAIFYVAPTVVPPPPAYTPKTQTFTLNIANITDSPDCVTKTYPVANGNMPGQTIRVKSGDTIVANVFNRQEEPVTIHWHGLRQLGTPWMDGNEGGSQCPIGPGKNFTYVFSTGNQVGTFWWHAHAGLSRATIYGALIIDPVGPEKIPPYVNDRVIMLSDWYHRSHTDILAGLDQASGPYIPLGLPDSLLINGRSRTDCGAYKASCALKPSCLPCTPAGCKPLSVIPVNREKTYRLRLINAGLYANINFFLQGHVLTVVEADGQPVKPITYNSLDILPGHTFSVLVSTNQQGSNYWITTTGRFDNTGVAPGVAILRYGGPDKNPPGPPPPAPSETKDPTFSSQQAYSFRNLFPISELSKFVPNRRLLIRWGIHKTNGRVMYSVNNVSFTSPRVPLMYAEYTNTPNVFDTNIIPSFGAPLPTGPAYTPCKMATSAISIPANANVEMVFQSHNPPGLLHPWHLHGYHFYVVARGMGEYDYDNPGKHRLSYNLVDPPLRDTVTVYQDEWVAVLFKADNVGMFHLHCHLEPHAHLGMQTFLRVYSDKYPAPPASYDKSCFKNRTVPLPVTRVLSPPPPASPTITGGNKVIDWSFGKMDVVKIPVGATVTWQFSITDNGVHALSPAFGAPATQATYDATTRLLKQLPIQTGIVYFWDGVTPNSSGLGLNISPTSIQKIGFKTVIRFTTPGTYVFTCPLHWMSMVTTIIVA